MNGITCRIRAMLKLYRKIIPLYFIEIVLFVFFIEMSIAPINKIREFNYLIDTDSVYTNKFDSIYFNPEMSNILKDKIYKEALLKLSELDSIQMVINLSDSTVNLSIKGVMIHQTKVSEIKKDKILRKMPLIQEIKLFSQPLPVHFQFATIIKGQAEI